MQVTNIVNNPRCPTCNGRMAVFPDKSWRCPKCAPKAQEAPAGFLATFVEVPTHKPPAFDEEAPAKSGEGEPLPAPTVPVIHVHAIRELSEETLGALAKAGEAAARLVREGRAPTSPAGRGAHDVITRQLAEEKPGAIARLAASRIVTALAAAGYVIYPLAKVAEPEAGAPAPAQEGGA